MCGNTCVENLNVSQLQAILSTVHEDEQAVPFLLRFVLGEFKYGQQAVEKNAKTPSSPTKEEIIHHKSNVARAFDVLADESRFNHLHQMAGWLDIDSVSVWDAYVEDVMGGKLRDGDRLFEAGCGVLAFLRSAEQLAKNVIIGGLDGSEKTIQLIKDTYVKEEHADNFFTGFLPDALFSVPDDSWDIVVCNSVFQYLQDKELAKRSVEEMIRVARRWIIIADVIDEKYYTEAQGYRKQLADDTRQESLPDYTTYARSWWDQFDTREHLLSIKKVESQTYIRRRERYTVYIEKNAPTIEAIPDTPDNSQVRE